MCPGPVWLVSFACPGPVWIVSLQVSLHFRGRLAASSVCYLLGFSSEMISWIGRFRTASRTSRCGRSTATTSRLCTHLSPIAEPRGHLFLVRAPPGSSNTPWQELRLGHLAIQRGRPADLAFDVMQQNAIQRRRFGAHSRRFFDWIHARSFGGITWSMGGGRRLHFTVDLLMFSS